MELSETIINKHQVSSKRDELLPKFSLGQKVRLLKDVKNDGTFASKRVGEVLAKAGEEGYIRHMGDFLQVIRVYDVDFITQGAIIGCREEELENADTSFMNDVECELEWLRKHRENKKTQS
jgi:nitrogen fixation protein NifZ